MCCVCARCLSTLPPPSCSLPSWCESESVCVRLCVCVRKRRPTKEGESGMKREKEEAVQGEADGGNDDDEEAEERVCLRSRPKGLYGK